VVLLLSMIVGIVRGLVFECLSLAGWLVAWFGAQWAAPQLAPAPAGGHARLGLRPGREPSSWPFVAALVAWSLLARLIRMLIHATPLSLPDRLLGAGFGLLRAVVLLLAVATAVLLTPAAQSQGWRASHGARCWADAASAQTPVARTRCSACCRPERPPRRRTTHHVRHRRRHRHKRQSTSSSTTRCCCCSTAARTRPASSPCRAPSASCTRRAAWCGRVPHAQHAGLPGTVGLGQVRYPTAGNAYSEEEAQPFYVNAPYGIVLVHNGNLTNAQALKAELFDIDRRHINTESDTEVLINVLAHELELVARDLPLSPEHVFKAVGAVHKRIKGSYAVIALIAGHGLLAFRDPYGIRPLCYGEADREAATRSWWPANPWRWKARATS
jgi:uncharacterized membrane protein required for colicin V production